MATLYVTEYKSLAEDRSGNILPIPMEPADVNQTVTFTTTTQSAAFRPATRYVRLQADANCHVLFGADPTATTSHQPLLANVEYFRGVQPGEKVAAVTAA